MAPGKDMKHQQEAHFNEWFVARHTKHPSYEPDLWNMTDIDEWSCVYCAVVSLLTNLLQFWKESNGLLTAIAVVICLHPGLKSERIFGKVLQQHIDVQLLTSTSARFSGLQYCLFLEEGPGDTP